MSTESFSLSVLIYIHRLKEFFDVKRDDELSEKLGLSKQAISNWRARGKVPLKFQQSMLDRHGFGYVEWSVAYSPLLSDVTYAVSVYCCHQCLKKAGEADAKTWRNIGQVFPEVLKAVGQILEANPNFVADIPSAIEFLLNPT